MSCREVKRLIYLYREGEIPEETRRLVHEHAASCRSCARELRQAGMAGLFIANLRSAEPRAFAQRDLTDHVMRGVELARAGKTLPRKTAVAPFRRLQIACTFAAAAIVGAFFIQSVVDVYRVAELESRLSQIGPPGVVTADEPPLATLGFKAVAEFGRLVAGSPGASGAGLRGRMRLEETVRSFFDVLQGGPPGFVGEVQRLRGKYPELWHVSPLDGVTPRERLVLNRQGKALLNDLRSLLQPGRSENEK